MINSIAIQELSIFIDNDSELYNRIKKPIFTNLQKHVNKSRFCKERAAISTMRLVEEGAKKYSQQFCGTNVKWHKVFHLNDRKELASYYVNELVVSQRCF